MIAPYFKRTMFLLITFERVFRGARYVSKWTLYFSQGRSYLYTLETIRIYLPDD